MGRIILHLLLGFEILIIVLSQVGHKCKRWREEKVQFNNFKEVMLVRAGYADIIIFYIKIVRSVTGIIIL